MPLRAPACIRVLSLTGICLVSSFRAAASDGRLLTTDAVEAIPTPVVGLQRTAVPVALGFVVDSSLLADLALAPNLGVRWERDFSFGRIVLGARYTLFVGGAVYSSFVQSAAPVVQSFEPSFSGPSVYGAYGYRLGAWLVELEGRYSHYSNDALTITAAAAYQFGGAWQAVAEGGVRLFAGPLPKGAVGVRYQGAHFGATLGVAYVGLSDPFLGGNVPVLPVLNLSWSF